MAAPKLDSPASVAPSKVKSKPRGAQSRAELQDQLRAMTRAPEDAVSPEAKASLAVRKGLMRAGFVLAVLWLMAGGVASWLRSPWPVAVMGGLTVIAAGAVLWGLRYIRRSQRLGSILKGAESAEGRKQALEQLSVEFKPGDAQALMARAQLEMQDDPRKALATLEQIDLGRQLQAVGDQVRSLRAMLHLTLGEAPEARRLVDGMELGKQQEAKVRAMNAAVASEAWGRTGDAAKGVEMLDLFNPDDPELGEVKLQLLRARAFVCAGAGDMKGVQRTLRRLAEINPQLLAMFVGQKRIHPLLEKEAQKVLMQSGALPRRPTPRMR